MDFNFDKVLERAKMRIGTTKINLYGFLAMTIAQIFFIHYTFEFNPFYYLPAVISTPLACLFVYYQYEKAVQKEINYFLKLQGFQYKNNKYTMDKKMIQINKKKSFGFTQRIEYKILAMKA